MLWKISIGRHIVVINLPTPRPTSGPNTPTFAEEEGAEEEEEEEEEKKALVS